jgi:GntR family transcriptional regulator
MDKPLYAYIAGQIRQRIVSGEYKPSDMLPSENELAACYQTSRVTVRKGFHILETEGLIRPHKGKGYFVLPPKFTTYTLDFGDSVPGGRFHYHEINIIRPQKDVAAVLQLKKHQMVIVLRSLMERGGRNVAYDEKFIPYERGTPVVELELQFAEFPDMFEKRYSPMSIHSELSIGVETAPEHVCRALSLEKDTSLLVVSRLISAEEDDGRPIGYGKQYLTEAYGSLTAKSGYFTSPEI